MRFSSAHYRRSARTGRRPRQLYNLSSTCGWTLTDGDVAAVIGDGVRNPFAV